MVDPVLLANDILGNSLFLALPAVLWLFLYLWAWEGAPSAEAAGFGRPIFWLLLPAALAASVADAPFFAWNGSVLAMNLGGAAIPIFLSVLLPARWWAPRGLATVGWAIVGLALVTVPLFVLAVLPLPALWAGAATVSVVAAAVGLGFLLVLRTPGSRAHPAGSLGLRSMGFVALALLALVLTYATTQAVPGVGILSVFPYYLAPPILVGVLAVLLARPLFALPPLAGVAIGYGSATFGVLIGADILRQPPLYGGAPGLLAIGGAGLLDLVYLTGLLAAAASFLTVRVLERHRGTTGSAPPIRAAEPLLEVTPAGHFRDGVHRDAAGDPRGALLEAAASAQGAVDHVRRLNGLPPAASSRAPWNELGVAPWVDADYANLLALSRLPDPTPSDAARGLSTAKLLLQLAADLGRRRYAGIVQRCNAFLLDLLVLTIPAVLIWALVIRTQPGNPESLLTGVPFNAAVLAYVAYGVAYFALGEAWSGATLGKRLVGIEVRTRHLARPGPTSILLRNAPRVIPLTILGEFAAVALVLLMRPATTTISGTLVALSGLAGVVLLFVGFAALLLVGGLTCAVLLLNGGRERLGDLWAGTWVIRRPVPAPPVAVPSA
jgi:uncharacterized membrane protein/uncharacterized RDD family membrane protein YckC